MLCCWLPDSILLKNIWDCQTRLNMNTWSKSAFAATAVPLGVQGEKIAKWRFFSKASSHLSYYSNHHRLTQEAADLGNRGIIPAWVAFPLFVKARWAQTWYRAERLTWVSLHGAGEKTGQSDPLSRFYFRVLALVLAKSFPSSEGFHLILATITKITFMPQLFLPSRVG